MAVEIITSFAFCSCVTVAEAAVSLGSSSIAMKSEAGHSHTTVVNESDTCALRHAPADSGSARPCLSQAGRLERGLPKVGEGTPWCGSSCWAQRCWCSSTLPMPSPRCPAENHGEQRLWAGRASWHSCSDMRRATCSQPSWVNSRLLLARAAVSCWTT